MAESTKPKDSRPEDIIAAFDRERDQAREWNRKHAEQVRGSRTHDRPVFIERRRAPR